MITETLLILDRKDVAPYCLNNEFNDINISSFSSEINKLMIKAALVIFRDDDWQTKILKSRYGFIEDLQINQWRIYDISQ